MPWVQDLHTKSLDWSKSRVHRGLALLAALWITARVLAAPDLLVQALPGHRKSAKTPSRSSSE